MSRFQCFSFFEKGNKGHLKMQMSTIKNGQILLYCHFDKGIKGLGTSFRSPALRETHVRNVSHTAH